MARILLNTRASRITIVNNILLLPAEIKADERLGNVVSPSKTLVSERGNPSPYQRIMGDKATARLFDAGIIEWSNEQAEEPPPPVNLQGRAPFPRIEDVKGVSDSKANEMRRGSPHADVDYRATIDESGVPLEALAQADSAVVEGQSRTVTTTPSPTGATGPTQPREGINPNPLQNPNPGERVTTDEQTDAVAKAVETHDRTNKTHHSKGGHAKGG
jgi:hypothetical protein